MSFRLIWSCALIAALLGPAQARAGSTQPFPHLAGTLPPVEGALRQALEAGGLAGQVVRIAADTNGHLTVAAIDFGYEASGPDPRPALQARVWALARASFAAVPGLDELDLSGHHHEPTPFDPGRTDVTFSAAITRAEFGRVPPGASGAAALGSVQRVWYHPLLGLPQEARGGALQAESVRRPPPALEQSPTFAGPPGQQLVERVHRSTGRTSGEIVAGKLYRGDPARPIVALTFDDGPLPIYTTLLLDTLRRSGIRATFFLIGRRTQQYPYFAQALAAAGHEVANHTFHHVNLTRLPPDQVAQELSTAQQAIAAATGQTPRFFRPPGGDYNLVVLRAARAAGLATVFWTDDPADYARPGEAVLEQRLLTRVSNGGILLLHQGVAETIEVLPVTLAIMRRRGFVVTTVTGMLAP